jgi:hypothetical protein
MRGRCRRREARGTSGDANEIDRASDLKRHTITSPSSRCIHESDNSVSNIAPNPSLSVVREAVGTGANLDQRIEQYSTSPCRHDPTAALMYIFVDMW